MLPRLRTRKSENRWSARDHPGSKCPTVIGEHTRVACFGRPLAGRKSVARVPSVTSLSTVALWLAMAPTTARGARALPRRKLRIRTQLSLCQKPFYSCLKRYVSSDVSHKWLELCRKGFWPPARRERPAYPSWVCKARATKREAKRPAARRVAPKTVWGCVAPRYQSTGAMLPRRALPQAVLGAT